MNSAATPTVLPFGNWLRASASLNPHFSVRQTASSSSPPSHQNPPPAPSTDLPTASPSDLPTAPPSPARSLAIIVHPSYPPLSSLPPPTTSSSSLSPPLSSSPPQTAPMSPPHHDPSNSMHDLDPMHGIEPPALVLPSIQSSPSPSLPATSLSGTSPVVPDPAFLVSVPISLNSATRKPRKKFLRTIEKSLRTSCPMDVKLSKRKSREDAFSAVVRKRAKSISHTPIVTTSCLVSSPSASTSIHFLSAATGSSSQSRRDQ